ncbi:MAG: cyclase family protein [Verrucomicrobia subdivision 3 bacterium]|nr:cyclase family protein [Limisphaerales bacterium]
MKLIDLSQPVFDGCPNCPADPPVQSRLICRPGKDGWRVEQLTLTSHTGSHIDAPSHKILGGPHIDELSLESFTGRAVLADLRDSRPGQPFTSTWLARKLRVELAGHIVILVTGWGAKRARTEEWLGLSPYVSPDAAEWLVEQEIRGVGIDHYSIGGMREPQNSRTHEILLGAGVWILEDLNAPDELWSLSQPLEFWALPINLRGHSGAFCRPVVVVR